jgi:hypothetical protein
MEHLLNKKYAAVDTARRTPGIRNNIISDQTVRNRLRQSGLRSRHPRLQWARARLKWFAISVCVIPA